MAFSHLRTGEYLNLNFRTALNATLINFTFHRLRRPILMIAANQKIFIYDFIWEDRKIPSNYFVLCADKQLITLVAFIKLQFSRGARKFFDPALPGLKFSVLIANVMRSIPTTMATCNKQLNYKQIYLIWVTVRWWCFTLGVTSKVRLTPLAVDRNDDWRIISPLIHFMLRNNCKKSDSEWKINKARDCLTNRN